MNSECLSTACGTAFRLNTTDRSLPGTLQSRDCTLSEKLPGSTFLLSSKKVLNSMNSAFCIFNILCKEGLRKSISTSTTLLSIWAMASAMFTETVDFPSFSAALDTRSTFWPFSDISFRIRVANLRISSAYWKLVNGSVIRMLVFSLPILFLP